MMKKTAFEAHHAFWAKISIYRRVWSYTFLSCWTLETALIWCLCTAHSLHQQIVRNWNEEVQRKNDEPRQVTTTTMYNTSVMFRTLTLIFSYVMDHNCNPVSRFMMYPTNHSSSHGILDFFATRTVCLYIYNTHMYIC